MKSSLIWLVLRSKLCILITCLDRKSGMLSTIPGSFLSKFAHAIRRLLSDDQSCMGESFAKGA